MERGIIIVLLALLMGSAAQGQSGTFQMDSSGGPPGSIFGRTDGSMPRFSVTPPPTIVHAGALTPDGTWSALKMDSDGSVYAKCVN